MRVDVFSSYQYSRVLNPANGLNVQVGPKLSLST